MQEKIVACNCQSLFLHLLYRSGKHQLDTVELVYLRSARVVVYGNDIAFRMTAAQLLDNAFPDDVVRQAGKRLCADDIRYAAVNQLYHLGGQEPSFAGLVAAGDDILRIACKSCDFCRGIEVTACRKLFLAVLR